MKKQTGKDRRHFLKSSSTITLGFASAMLLPHETSATATSTSAEDEINIIGPKEGYSLQIGTLVSMMNWMRHMVTRSLKKLTIENLDYLHDEKANTMGAMLLHLAATERYYQLNTFDGVKWGSWDDEIKKQWDTASALGEGARKNIKGNNAEYYLNILKETRDKTLEEFKNRDDKWLMQVDKDWFWGPTNNYCKWFHVCEHESNHFGQIKWLASRTPGLKGNPRD